MLAEPTKAVLRIAAHKRLLDARYRSWSKDGEWGSAYFGRTSTGRP